MTAILPDGYPLYPEDVTCPKCGAPPDLWCRRLRGPRFGEWKAVPSAPFRAAGVRRAFTKNQYIRGYLNELHKLAHPHRERTKAREEAAMAFSLSYYGDES